MTLPDVVMECIVGVRNWGRYGSVFIVGDLDWDKQGMWMTGKKRLFRCRMKVKAALVEEDGREKLALRMKLLCL